MIKEIEEAVNQVFEEYKRATQKFGPFKSTHEGYAVILEELDEAWDEIKTNNRERATEEMIQVAAMVLRWIVDCGVVKKENTEGT